MAPERKEELEKIYKQLVDYDPCIDFTKWGHCYESLTFTDILELITLKLSPRLLKEDDESDK